MSSDNMPVQLEAAPAPVSYLIHQPAPKRVRPAIQVKSPRGSHQTRAVAGGEVASLPGGWSVEVFQRSLGSVLIEIVQKDPEARRYLNGITRQGHAQMQALKDASARVVQALFQERLAEKPAAPAAAAPLAVALDDPLATSRVRGLQFKQQVFASAEMCTAAEVASLLGVSTARVSQMRTDEKKLLALVHPTNGRALRYPRWQFEEPVFRALPRVLPILADDDGWGAWLFLTSSAPRLRGLTPLEVLRGRGETPEHQQRLQALRASTPDAVALVLQAAEDDATGMA